jgi:hypothetical protein
MLWGDMGEYKEVENRAVQNNQSTGHRFENVKRKNKTKNGHKKGRKRGVEYGVPKLVTL